MYSSLSIFEDAQSGARCLGEKSRTIEEETSFRGITQDWVNDPERLDRGVDIVNAEDRCAAQCTCHNAGDSPGVSISWIRNAEDLANHGLSRDRQHNRTFEPLK